MPRAREEGSGEGSRQAGPRVTPVSTFTCISSPSGLPQLGGVW